MKLSTKLAIGATTLLTGSLLTYALTRKEKKGSVKEVKSTPTFVVTKEMSVRISSTNNTESLVTGDIVITNEDGKININEVVVSFSIAREHPEDVKEMKKFIANILADICRKAIDEKTLTEYTVEEIKDFSDRYILEVIVK